MTNINLADAQAHLGEIIAGLNPGDQMVIFDKGEPLATLTRTGRAQWPCTSGSAKDTTHWMAPDFDAPLEEFREYMEK